MNTPLINPLILYLIGITPNLFMFCILFGVIAGCFGAIGFYCVYNDTCGEPDEHELSMLKMLKKLAISGFICIFISILIPSKDTMYAMLAASYTTPANIETIGEGTKEAIDYIFEKIDDMKENNEENN